MTLVFLSEYCGINTTAQVFHDLDHKGYHVFCYRHCELIKKDVFLKEQSAEDSAEDWVLCN